MSIFAVLFPGQGVQKLGMLSEFSGCHFLQETFDEASNILGYDLWKLIQCGSLEELNKTCRAQPAILVSSVAIWRVWRNKCDFIPKFIAGHSLGEYTALVCAGVIDFSDAVKLVELRGNFMQDSISPDVGMMSVIIGLDENVVLSVCENVSSSNNIVSLSAFNAPAHVVISGYRESVEAVNVICKKLGAKFICILPISIPSHCELMLPASKKLKQELQKIEFLTPIIPVINNVDVHIENNLNDIKKSLVRQMYMPVRWKEIIEYLVQCNVNIFIEMGPGKVLSNIVKRIVGDNFLVISINDLRSLNLGIEYLTLR